MLSLSNLLLFALGASSTAIVLPPYSSSATQIGNDIDSINDSITQLTDNIRNFHGPTVISDMRHLSDSLSAATQSIKTEDAVDDESAAFLVASVRDEVQPNAEDMLDALIKAEAQAKKGKIRQQILGWLQNLRNMMQNFGTGLAPKVPLDQRSELRKAMTAMLKDFDTAIKAYGGAVGVPPPN
ncbi:Ecp50-1 [Fulvia fulva]|uniref:Ecp50-1 n=1 Tax=Passalora fulva TaxID=5499 RepID=A0A1P8YXN4_PASFU|nr:Ecp50-1 [Fulvia fulva]AQA29271.1 extracellular protein 50-1 [Fulvia fulva]KAK4622281.1 Ecp50-1 [Fulvia fulva]KAK4623028.1 Ecp50-1 [Fulvia fulva]UJO19274.1 Ecp50-1 [Fulvia fulva]WPV15784.1 Ecp50-1 [Fulvia fulva]